MDWNLICSNAGKEKAVISNAEALDLPIFGNTGIIIAVMANNQYSNHYSQPTNYHKANAFPEQKWQEDGKKKCYLVDILLSWPIPKRQKLTNIVRYWC